MKQDTSWKRVLDKLLPEFLAFYFPKIYEAIDFAKEITFLDKELQQLLPQEDETGRRTVDKLVHVKLLDLRRKWKKLEHDPNPFAIATMAFLKTVDTKGNNQDRYRLALKQAQSLEQAESMILDISTTDHKD